MLKIYNEWKQKLQLNPILESGKCVGLTSELSPQGIRELDYLHWLRVDPERYSSSHLNGLPGTLGNNKSPQAGKCKTE